MEPSIGLEIIAFTAGLLSSTATVPQLYKMYKSKQADGISIFMFAMKNSANLLWLVFGILTQTYALVFWNIVSFTLSAAVICLTLSIAKSKNSAEPVPAGMDFSDNIVETVLIPVQAQRPQLKLVYSASKN